MKSWRRDLRIVPFALLGGVAVVAAGSCDAKSMKEHAAAIGASNPSAPVRLADGGIAPSSGGIVGNGPSGSQDHPPVPCAAGGDACPDGFMCCPSCCLSSFPPMCIPKTDAGCPLPDLYVDENALATNAYLDTVDGSGCEVDEGCLLGPGTRKVLRFDVQVPNQGTRDLVLGNPDAGGPFVYAQCHKHYHFTGFARYQLVSEADDKVVLVGRKQAFCARDSARTEQEAPFNPQYDCTSQGISIGWSDVYDHTIPCQYLDVTDVPAGNYRLEVEVNPDRTMTESRYDNNKATLRIKLPAK